ncbi:uncharacterized protein OCT59_019341 [Rhizophagus irregularis]|nr:hypothetical protein GLOIN_2v1784640 [Rhizophagus irregularis DAOM 181602=DAOM 197198]EXX62901.1 hypothetical protein RirG_157380 [Rhizophagus irregularis DAOM 197198w]POG62954.1 hypothetical protein GLOIN_2v1784640 [Rhizophagus irregularis DAOM 181602=DAOM 197198]UZO27135.1 hypothetical protein OCT59_019341 [Rhizophagus irregularis]GBC33689.1 hypothetical protein GLOIN_2v1784640 [Rhizophagus irregularis DAOM 181602=DAOM 197198]|eukprot:XP_025169820.1 hypothetical protein GLOIN_2v1784640 [Rhizophagus irregularis DAOM 181602=DAOM 197198]
MKFTCPTAINNYVKCILSAKEYNNTEKYVKDHKIVLKKLDIKNNVQLTYLLFTFTAFANEYEIFMKSFIEKTFQKQVAQLESTESTNDMPVHDYDVKSMNLKILENAEHQSMVIELSNLNNEN